MVLFLFSLNSPADLPKKAGRVIQSANCPLVLSNRKILSPITVTIYCSISTSRTEKRLTRWAEMDAAKRSACLHQRWPRAERPVYSIFKSIHFPVHTCLINHLVHPVITSDGWRTVHLSPVKTNPAHQASCSFYLETPNSSQHGVHLFKQLRRKIFQTSGNASDVIISSLLRVQNLF